MSGFEISANVDRLCDSPMVIDIQHGVIIPKARMLLDRQLFIYASSMTYQVELYSTHFLFKSHGVISSWNLFTKKRTI